MAYLSGAHGSIFALHCEDGHLVSVNIIHDTGKLWYVVAEKDGPLIEQAIQSGKCAQRVRHASRWFSKSELEAIGASFVIFVQRKNEVVVTLGPVYHQGGTIGKSRAEAINYAPPGWSIEGYSQCSSSCTDFPIPNEYLEFRAPDEPQLEQDDERPPELHMARSRRRRATKAADVTSRKRGGSSPTRKPSGKRRRTSNTTTETVAEKDDWNAKIEKMAKSIYSPDAIKQFFSIVRGRRLLDPTALRISSANPTQMAKDALGIIHSFSDKGHFNQFIVRLAQVHLAPIEKLPRGETGKSFKERGLYKSQYYFHRNKGLNWRQYSNAFPGIVGFLLFQTKAFGFSSTDWHKLSTDGFDALVSHLEAKGISEICSAGERFESSLDLSADDVEFVGETRSLDNLREKDLISLLRPVETTEEIVHVMPGWDRPEYWPDHWDWPVDPTFVPPSEQQCVYCDESECDCARQRPELQPRIRIYEKKGRGLQAVAREAGHIAYRKGTRLGWFIGTPVPPNTKSNGWCYLMRRDDLEGQPEVALLDSTETKNLFSLMSHDCNPTVHLVGKRVSGQYRVEVQAKRDIRDGDELTMDYGRDYWPGGCPCPNHVI
jgi:hypothetical protein